MVFKFLIFKKKIKQFFKNHEVVGGLLAMRKEVGKTAEEGRVKPNGKNKV